MISDFYPNKKTHRFISCRAGCVLRFAQRWVYSYLVFHAKHATVNALSVALGMKHQTVKNAVAKLVELGLAKSEGRKVHACEPTQDWFARWKNGEKSWHESFGYSQVKVMGPQCPLTLTQNTLYWLLVSLAKGQNALSRQSCAGLAKTLGVNRKTVARGLEELRFCQLIVVKQAQDFFDVRLVEPDKDVVSWFQDKPASERWFSTPDAVPEQWKRAEVVIEEIDESGPVIPAHFTKLASNLTTLTNTQQAVLSVFLKDGFVEPQEVWEIDDAAEREHRHNQRYGKIRNSGHHGALLWHKLLKRAEWRGMDTSKYAKLR